MLGLVVAVTMTVAMTICFQLVFDAVLDVIFVMGNFPEAVDDSDESPETADDQQECDYFGRLLLSALIGIMLLLIQVPHHDHIHEEGQRNDGDIELVHRVCQPIGDSPYFQNNLDSEDHKNDDTPGMAFVPNMVRVVPLEAVAHQDVGVLDCTNDVTMSTVACGDLMRIVTALLIVTMAATAMGIALTTMPALVVITMVVVMRVSTTCRHMVLLSIDRRHSSVAVLLMMTVSPPGSAVPEHSTLVAILWLLPLWFGLDWLLAQEGEPPQ